LQEKIRGMGGELRVGIPTRGDGHRAGADRAGAGDIVRGVAEHENASGRELGAMPFLGAGPRERAERVAVVVIVRERSELEVVPDAIVSQLEFRPALQVAGEEREDDVFAWTEGIEKRQHAWQERAFLNREFEREMMQIAVEELREVFGGGGESMRGEHGPGDAGIGAAGDLHRGQIVVDAKVIAKAEAERALAGAPGSEERAVDIEKEQFFVQALNLSARAPRAQAKPFAAPEIRRGQGTRDKGQGTRDRGQGDRGQGTRDKGTGDKGHVLC